MQVKEQDNFFEEFEECLKSKKYDQAEKIIKQLRQQFPKNHKYIRSYIALLKIVDYDKAIEFTKTLLSTDKTGEFHATLLSLLVDSKRYDEAMVVINDTLNKNYDSYLSYFNFCFAQINFTRDKSNASMCLRATKQSLRLKETFYANKLAAMIYTELKDFDNTREYFLKAIDLADEEKDKSLYFDFAKSCLSFSKFEDSKFYDCCRFLNTKKGNLSSLLAIWKNNDYKKLEDIFSKIDDKENEDFYNMLLAVSALNENKNKVFINRLENINDEKTKKDVLTFLVAIYNRDEKFDISNTILGLSLFDNSNNNDVRYDKVKALYVKRKYKDALELANSFLSVKKSNNLLLLKGKILCDLAMHDKAEDIYIDLIKYNNFDSAKLELANMYASCGDFVNAKKLLCDVKRKKFAITKRTEICIYENKLEEAKRMAKNIEDEKFSVIMKIIIAVREQNFEYAKYLVDNYSYDNLDSRIRFYVDFMNGKNRDVKPKSYFEALLINYDKDIVKEHIKQHFKDDDRKVIHNVFNNNVSVDYIYNKCIGMINNRTYHISTGFSDQYIFDLGEYVGNVNGILTSYVMVVTYPNSNKIITIYPTFGKSLFKGIDSKENNNKLRVRK